MRKDLKVLVAGCGSIGQRHIKNLRSLGIKDFILCDMNRFVLDKAAYGLTSPVLVSNLRDAIRVEPHAAVICTPSSMHLDMATELAKNGVHILIEKPLSHTLEGVKALDLLVHERGLVGMMAMCYRFHPVLRHIKSLLDSEVVGRIHSVNYFGGHYLPDWHPHSDYRAEYASRKSLGGGVVLTSIHGIDNIRWLFGEVSQMHSFADKVSGLEMDVEDIAVAIFRMESGAYVSWQTDFLQRASQHRIVIAGEKGTIRCDLTDGTVETYFVDFGKWFTGKIPFETNGMYMDEMEYFLGCVEKKTHPEMDIEEGSRTLKLALEVKEYGSSSAGLEKRCLTA